MVKNEGELNEFMKVDQEHASSSQVEWKIQNGRLRFVNVSCLFFFLKYVQLNEEKLNLRSMGAVNDMIKYATEIERIC